MNNIFFWLIFVVIIASILNFISEVLPPFILAFILSYLLQPLVKLLCSRLRINRNYSIAIVLSGCVALGTAILVFIIPILISQISTLLLSLPEYKNNIQNNLLPLIQLKLSKLDPELSLHAKQAFFDLINHFFNSLMLMFNNFWVYTKATIGIIVIIILVPIISFYLLLDWVKTIESIKSLFPKKHKETIIDLFKKIDILLAAYIRGQLNVCLILAFYYILLLSLIGLKFSFLIGLMSGFLIVIPFIGTFISLGSSLFIVYATFCDDSHFMYVLLIYLLGHIIDAYILAPRIIGENLGLNPVWILFAVLTGATIFGFVGALVSIPIAGIMKVILNFLIDIYKRSKYYN